MKFKPHKHQVPAIAHIHDTPRGVLWMPMGGGKTVSVLTALEELSVLEPIYPALVLAPLRVANSVWRQEVAKWDHTKHLRVSVVTGTVDERLASLRKHADIYVMNYDNLVWLKEHLGKKWPFKTIIADELTRLKSFRITQGSKRAHALAYYAFSAARFIGLTGTPAPNGLQDLWGQIWFCDKGKRLGKAYTHFKNRWFRLDYDGFGLVPFDHTQGELNELLRDICLTVEGLPVDAPIRNHVMVQLPPRARELYDDMQRQFFIELEKEEITAVNGGVKAMKCMQLANGAVYYNEATEFEEVHRVKIDALESIIEEANGAPVLVAYHFKSDLARLKKAFPKARHLDANPNTIEQWNRGEIPILLAHPASAGHGLNLAEGGNILAFFGMNWNLEEHMQIIERIGPMRQAQAGLKRPVFVHYIVAQDTVDEMILDRIETKKTVQSILLAAMQRIKGKAAVRAR